MRLTIPHYFDFGPDRARIGRSLAHPGGWDAARETEGAFGLPATRSEWEPKADDASVRGRAADVAAVARGLRARRVCSYGVGTGVLELAVTRAASELEVTCTEYAPRTVERLRTLFGEATVVEHDLRRDPPLEADLHLLHRVDTEFPNDELRAILLRFEQPVLLVPSALLTWRLVAREALTRVTRPRATRAGWLRSEAAFRTLWRGELQARDVTVGADPAFLLEKA